MGKKALAAVVTTLIVIVVLAIALYHLLAAGFQDGFVTAKLSQGYVRGKTEKTPSGVEFMSFKGIPYAQPPIGDLRFKAPRPSQDWDGILDGTQHKNSCVSFDERSRVTIGDENCLFVNVYTTELGGSRPVMVWIHGGGFSTGNGNDTRYGPQFLLEQGVVVVTLNYRLGVLGFLSTADSLVTGNAGLKDQVMALRWVQANIAKFGGNPDAVTIFGTDAGGASVNYHILSPLSKGLFAKAVSMSGSALNPWAFSSARSLRTRAFRLGEALAGRAFDDDSVALVAFLATVAAPDLVTSAAQQDKSRILAYAFVPCAEVAEEGAFLTEPPSRVLSEGRLNHVPFMTGSVSGDGKLALHNVGIPDNITKLEDLDANFDSVVAPEMRLKGAQERSRAAAMIRDFYFEQSAITPSLAQSIRDFLTDMLFLEGIDAFARVMGKDSNNPVFYYYFTYEGNVTLVPGVVDRSGVPGVPHGGDIAYLWKFSDNRQNLNPTSEEATVRSTFVKLLTNFAKTGAPTMQIEQRDRWEPFTANRPVYLDIDSPLSLRKNLFKARLDFWRFLLPLA